MDDSVQLPTDIVTEILLKLPVKSILKFKTVCKSWNSIISDYHFTKRHLKLALFVPDCNFVSLCSHGSNPLLLYTQDADGTIRAQPFGISDEYESHSLCNSCDGLICSFLGGDREQIFVWNPCILTQVKIIPTIPSLDDEITLGYDPTSDDYKIVEVPSKCSIKSKYVRVETFSFKTNSWKTMWFRVGKSEHYFITQVLVYAKNRVHWFATDKEIRRIMCFDLVGEMLELMNLPSQNLFCPTLMNQRDSIAISGLNYSRRTKYWVLEDYCGMKSSWKKMLRLRCNVWNISRWIGVTLNGECFVQMREGELRIHDPKDGNLEDVIKGNHVIPVKKCYCSFSSISIHPEFTFTDTVALADLGLMMLGDCYIIRVAFVCKLRMFLSLFSCK